MEICRELNSAVVADPAKMPQGCSDISPASTVELYAWHLPKCAYCQREHQGLTWNETWRERIFRGKGFWPKTPICKSCKQKIHHGEVPVTLEDTDMVVKTKLNSLKSKAHYLSISGGTMDQLRGVIREMEDCSQLVMPATKAFQELATQAAAAGAKLEWIQSLIRDATEVIERKTKATYSFCRKVANRVISMPDVRRAVFERADFKCELCGALDFLSVDHIIPVKRGGQNLMSNLQCLCISCNSSKGAK